MSVITISRGSFSRGKEVAEAVASKLGYECVSRDILVEASEEFNIPEIKLAKAMHDAPSVLDRFNHGRERYISYVQSALLNHLTRDNIVYHGLAGHFFLQEISHVLKVRIIASMESRILEEVKRENCSEEQALYRIQRDDEERRRWSMQIYNRDSWDSRLYDLVLHIDSLTVDDAVEMLTTTIQKEQFQPTEESLQKLKNRALLANITARIVKDSPMAMVRLADHKVVALANLEGNLKIDSTARKQLAAMLCKDFNLNDVLFQDPVQTERDYVNTWYNLDLA